MRHLHLQTHFLSQKHCAVHFEQEADSILRYAIGKYEGHQVLCLATPILTLAHKVRSFLQSNMAMEEWDNNYNTTRFNMYRQKYLYFVYIYI